MSTEILITKGDRTIVDSFADEQEEAEIRAILAQQPAGLDDTRWDRLTAWHMSLAAAHMEELGLPVDFTVDDLAGISFSLDPHEGPLL